MALKKFNNLIEAILDLAASRTVEGQKAITIRDPGSGVTAFMQKTDVAGLGQGYQ